MNYKTTILWDHNKKKIVDYVSKLYFEENASLDALILLFKVNEIEIDVGHEHRQWAIKYIKKLKELEGK